MKNVSTRIGLGVIIIALVVGLKSIHSFAQDNSGTGPQAGRGHALSGRGGRWGGPAAHRRGGPMAGGPLGFAGALPMIAARLDLTDAQREQVRGVLEGHRDEMKALGQRAFTAHQALRATVFSDVVNEGTIRARSADVAAVDAEIAVAQARVHAEIWPILTPDQQERARQLQADMAKRHEERRERWRNAPAPGERRGR